MSHNWTESAAEIATLAAVADAIEIAGCHDLGEGSIERCDAASDADLWSVYFHFPGEWESDPNDLSGCIDVADRDTPEEAAAFADELASRFGLPIHNFS